MNFRSLQQFLALAEHLHFARASAALNISSSALSRNIRQLEADLGTVLFTRDNRSVAITDQGRQFQTYARDAVSRWQAIRQELAQDADVLRGELSLYCSVTASYSILSHLLHRFRENHPGIEIKLHTGDPEHALGRIVEDMENIAIAAEPATLPRGVVFAPVTESPLLFIAPVGPLDAASKLPPASPAEWAQIPMILSEEGVARGHTNNWFRDLGINPRIHAQVAGNEAIVSMVSLGLGVGVVPKIVLDNSPVRNQVCVLPVKPALPVYNVGLVALKRNLANPLVRAFWDLA